MKYIVSLLIIGTVVSIVQTEIILTKDQEKKLVEHHKVCTVPSRDQEFLEKIVSGDLIDDQQFKEYLFCVSKRVGFQNEAGEVQKEVIVEKLKKSIEDPSRAEEYTETCLAKKSASPTDTVYDVVNCINTISPKSSILSS